MLDDARVQLALDAADPLLPETVRRAAGSALASLDAYVRIRVAEARRPTDPAGHQLVKPQAR
jgi:hypothetical protein